MFNTILSCKKKYFNLIQRHHVWASFERLSSLLNTEPLNDAVFKLTPQQRHCVYNCLEWLPFAENSVFNGVHVLCRNPVDPVSRCLRWSKLNGLKRNANNSSLKLFARKIPAALRTLFSELESIGRSFKGAISFTMKLKIFSHVPH